MAHLQITAILPEDSRFLWNALIFLPSLLLGYESSNGEPLFRLRGLATETKFSLIPQLAFQCKVSSELKHISIMDPARIQFAELSQLAPSSVNVLFNEFQGLSVSQPRIQLR